MTRASSPRPAAINLKKAGKTLLLVEQNVEAALGIADRGYIIDQGTVVHNDTTASLLSDPEIQERYYEV
jgi:branched-chain amino acid transport system ATP-binding protein